MKRRQILSQLAYTSGGLIGASLLAGCGRSVDPLFLLNLLDPTEPLPQHVLTSLTEFYVQSYALPATVDREQWQLEITGAVTNLAKISFQEILNAPQQDFYLTMECIGNPAGGIRIEVKLECN